MAEINTPRLMAAAKEFNIGTGTLTDFLVSKGFEASDLKPSSKISEEMYRVLQVEFQPDKVARQKAEQIDLPKNMRSGIDKALRILKNVEGISHIELDEEDVVRHKLVKAIIKAYDKDKDQEMKNEQR